MMASVGEMLSLCRRGGWIISGDVAVRKGFERKKVKLLILAEDASERTKNFFCELAVRHGIPVIVYGSKSELGSLLNKPPRAVAAVTNYNLAQGILKAIGKGSGSVVKA